ncbi:MAG: AAA family ATPase [Bacteroidia bacterium]
MKDLHLIHDGQKTTLYMDRSDPLKPVVIKMLRNTDPSKEELEMLLNEFNLTHDLQLDEVRQVYGKGIVEDRQAIYLEYVEGASLKKTEVASFEEKLNVAIILSRAVSRIHARGILHRDLTANNVMIAKDAEDYRVKLIDFAFARRLSPGQHLPPGERAEGTLAYISPEQTGRLSRPVDHRADLYSLGVVLYEWFTGQLPFKLEDAAELLHAHLAQTPPHPHTISPDLPGPVARIILQLLEKEPEARYASAEGLARDLAYCQKSIKKHGEITSFNLSLNSATHQLALPDALYERNQHNIRLAKMFERLRLGTHEYVRISGETGTGKTSLAMSFSHQVRGLGGYFAQGNFSDRSDSEPLKAFVEAFEDLVHQLLAEDSAGLEVWKRRLRNALGDEASVITAIIPDLSLILGEQVDVKSLGTKAASNRLRHLFLKFIQVLGTSEKPMVLFLDDAQWMNDDDVRLIRLLVESRPPFVAVIFAHRAELNSDVKVVDKLWEQLEQENVIRDELVLNNLSLEGIEAMLRDALGQDDVVELAELLLGKTQGNPFFTKQTLLSIHERGLISYDPLSSKWIWNRDGIREMHVTDNVVTLMAEKISVLTPDTSESLEMGSILGETFTLSALQHMTGKDPAGLIVALNQAIGEGLLVDLTHPSGPADVVYRFTHARIHEAVYQNLSENDLPLLHLKAGRFLYSQHQATELSSDEHLFETVDQWNKGIVLVDGKEDRRTLARLNLEAGRRAIARSAYKAALNYLQNGLDLLVHYGWENHYNLNNQLNTEAIKAAYLEGNYNTLDLLTDRQIRQAVNLMDKVEAYELRILSLITRERIEEAVSMGLAFLTHLGIKFPANPRKGHYLKALYKIRWTLRSMEPHQLLELPACDDPQVLAALRIMSVIGQVVFIANPKLSPLITFKALHMSITKGNSMYSVGAYLGYGMWWYQYKNQFAKGYAFGELSLKLADRFPDSQYRPRAVFNFYSTLAVLRQPLRDILPKLLSTYHEGIKAGDLATAGFAIDQYIYLSFFAGRSIDPLSRTIKRFLKEMQDMGQEGAVRHLRVTLDICRKLQTGEAEDQMVDMSELEAYAQTSNYDFGRMAVLLPRLFMACLFEKSEEALQIADTLKKQNEAVPFFAIGIFPFYDALACLSLMEDANRQERQVLSARVTANRKQLEKLSASAPANFLHRLFLLQAEENRLLGKENEARPLYDKAIQLARENGFRHEEALGLELTGKFYRAQRNRFLAESFLKKAHAQYMQWGARAKAEHMAARYPHFIQQQRHHSLTLSRTPSSSGLSDIDLSSINRAAIALSAEVVLSNLLASMLKILIENAGAERGAFILCRNEKLMVVAEGDRNRTETDVEVPVEQSERLSSGIVNYAARKHQEIVLDHAASHSNFSRDPYVQRTQPLSVLCYPVLYKGKLTGLIYLENNLTRGAFTEDRIEVLRILSAQIGVSIENALLYASLDEKVKVRTRELNTKNQKLSETLQALKSTQGQLVQSEKMASLGQLTAGIAHEINNPINFVSANIGPLTRDIADLKELFEKAVSLKDAQDIQAALEEMEAFREEIEADELFDEVDSLLRGIKEGALRTKNIVAGLKNFSRMDEEEFMLADVHEGLDSTLVLLQNRTKNRIAVKKEYGEIPRISCLPGKLNQVFMNILVNATQAIEGEGTITIRTEAEKTNDIATQVRIHISDDGKGMAEDVANRIFEPFYTTKDVGQGTGLGLSISYGIVQQHNGEVEVSSKPGEGTTFTIELPVMREE